MTKNQQKIIDSLIAEFNSRNEKKTNQSNSLIDLDELDAINQRHRDLTADAQRSLELWQEQRREYIDMLIEKIRGEIGHRLCVERGDVASNNPNLCDKIFIYKYGTEKYLLNERSFRFSIELTFSNERDDITKEWYRTYNGIKLTRYVFASSVTEYKDEVELFNCKWTKEYIKELLL